MWWVRRVRHEGTRGRVRVSMIASSERADDVVLPNLLPSPLYERESVLRICPTRTPRPTIPGFPEDVGVDAVNPRD